MPITPNDPADFTPARGSYKELSPFRFWCQKVLPLVYDDSLSYYELLNKVVQYLNMTMEDVTTLEGDVTNLHTAYVQLQTYVNDYFVSLDVQEEINNKLDEMAESGALTPLISPLLPSIIADWLSENMTPTTPPIDRTLSIENAGADSKRTGEAITSLYSNSKSYKQGDVVLYDGVTYECVTEILIGESFDKFKWRKINSTLYSVENRNLLNSGEYSRIGFTGTLDECTSSLNNQNWIGGQKYLFKKGYVSGVRVQIVTAETYAEVILCNANMRVLYIAGRKITQANNIIPVNFSVDEDFYLLVHAIGVTYCNKDDVYSTEWMGITYTANRNIKIGDTFPSTFNNGGHIGFGFEVIYNSIIPKIQSEINFKKEIPFIAQSDYRVLWYQDENHVLHSEKTGDATTSGCYPTYFNNAEKAKFKIISNPSWVIIAKNNTGEFVSLGFQGAGIIFASFNSDGSVKSVDWTANPIANNWIGDEITLIWEDEYFLSIYRNDKFFWKLDIRHTAPTILNHALGIGVYSNQANGERIQLLPIYENYNRLLYDVDVLGDSFTDNTRDALGAGTFYFTRWYEFAKTICNIENVNNYGYGGTTMSPVVSGENSFYNRMQSMALHAGAVFVQGGTNDYHYDVPLGSISDDTTNTFYGTLNKMCEYLKEYYHDCNIVFMTPIMRVSPSQNKTETTPANNQTNSNGNTLEQFANAMIETCNKWSIPCFDAYHLSGICPQARNTQNYSWFMHDGIHLNQYGHRRLGIRFGEFAKMYMP